jgi:RecB family exonuclease
MAAVSETFGRALAMDRARWRTSDFGPYDGKVSAPDLTARLQDEHGRFVSAISPSRLESYANCPFQYFLTYVLRVQELEEPAEEFDLPPLERGLLVHELLSRLYEEGFRGKPLGSMTADEIDAAVDRAGEILDELGAARAHEHPATWAAEREKTLDQVRALLAHDRDAHGDGTPDRLEYAFGLGDAPGFVFDLDDDASIAFRGRIDRVDQLPQGAIRIIDYKTGSSSHYRKNRFLGGSQLQLPVYLLAAGKLLGAGEGEALYLAVREPKDVPEFTLAELGERMADFRRALALIVGGIAAGDFFPLPADHARYACEKYCRFRNVCGAARGALAEMKQTDPAAAALRELRDIE